MFTVAECRALNLCSDSESTQEIYIFSPMEPTKLEAPLQGDRRCNVHSSTSPRRWGEASTPLLLYRSPKKISCPDWCGCPPKRTVRHFPGLLKSVVGYPRMKSVLRLELFLYARLPKAQNLSPAFFHDRGTPECKVCPPESTRVF